MSDDPVDRYVGWSVEEYLLGKREQGITAARTFHVSFDFEVPPKIDDTGLREEIEATVAAIIERRRQAGPDRSDPAE